VGRLWQRLLWLEVCGEALQIFWRHPDRLARAVGIVLILHLGA
jgi:hypothetical protein